MALSNIQCKFTGPDGDLTVTVPIEEYNDLVEARASIDLILTASDEHGCGGESVIKAAMQKRAECVLCVKRVDEPAETPREPEQAKSKRVTYAGMDLEIRPGDKVRYVGNDGCGHCKACDLANGAVGTVTRVTYGRECPVEVRWPNCSSVIDTASIAFVSREDAP